MGLFRKNGIYDRKHYLKAALDAQKSGKHKRALPYLRRILAAEPNNPEIHSLIAPTLAESGWHFSAWQSYGAAAETLLAADKPRPALQLYRDATKRMPKHFDAWMTRYRLELRMTLRDDAKKTLEAARKQFRDRGSREQAIALLRLLAAAEPGNAGVMLDLAHMLAKTGQKEEALWILERLAQQATGIALRKVRKAQWSIMPTLSHTWLLLRASSAR